MDGISLCDVIEGLPVVPEEKTDVLLAKPLPDVLVGRLEVILESDSELANTEEPVVKTIDELELVAGTGVEINPVPVRLPEKRLDEGCAADELVTKEEAVDEAIDTEELKGRDEVAVGAPVD